MFLTMRFVVTISLAAAANLAAAQDPSPQLPPFQTILPERINEIRETSDGISVRGSLEQPDGRTTNLVISC